ncbi:MAG TPA: cellulase family glycosylhydrolase [Solirubrobacteraceae bacterium]|nr:cellulase family glycosylhydrolase [Solirubrobacteraceae bacterium]
MSPALRRNATCRTVLAVVAAFLLAAAGAALAAASAGAAEAGVNISSPSSQQISSAKALGTKWVRMFVNWRAFEPAPGDIDPGTLAAYEQGFKQLPAGTKVILDVVDTPAWETGSADEHAPPANPADYAQFVAALASRLSHWVGAFEIWNEEDAPSWWTGAPNPAAYTQLLQATYPAVKAVDPSAAVLLGGLTGNDYSFLEGVYSAGGKGYFDAVAVHTDTACDILSPYEFLRGPDNRMIPDSFLAYREVHAVMLANGDDKPIWMTELSWRTTSNVCSEGAWAGQKAEGVSDEQQATYLRQAYHCLAQDPYVQVALWFPLQDNGPVTSGLIRSNGSKKPSYEAMREYVRQGDTLKEECGTFTGPTIDIASPSNLMTYSGPLRISVSAHSRAGVFRITLEVDGRLIRNYGGKTYPDVLSGYLEWQGAKHIAYGRHTLTFLAYDRMHNVSQRSITIIHARSGSGGGGSPSGGSRHGKHKAKHHRKHHRKRH